METLNERISRLLLENRYDDGSLKGDPLHHLRGNIVGSMLVDLSRDEIQLDDVLKAIDAINALDLSPGNRIALVDGKYGGLTARVVQIENE